MKKEYVKPQNRVVELKDRLMDGEWASQGPDTPIFDSKEHFDDDASDSSDDVWED